MIDFMKPVVSEYSQDFECFDKKIRLAEAILEGVRCRLSWNSDGKVSFITEENQDITDRFHGVMYEDSMRLRNTELEGYLMAYREKETMPTPVVNEMITYDKDSINQILSSTGLKVRFVPTDLLSFISVDFKDENYSTRKLKIEDVLISIDNTFEMKFKEYYTLSHPLQNTAETFKAITMKGHAGMIFKKVNSEYAP